MKKKPAFSPCPDGFQPGNADALPSTLRPPRTRQVSLTSVIASLCGARRGNLAVLAGTRESLRRTRSIHKVIDSHSSMNYCSSALRAILGSPFGRAGRRSRLRGKLGSPFACCYRSNAPAKALSVTFGDSSPRGRAKGLQLNHSDAGGKRSQACSCVPPQKPAQVQPDIRPFSMPSSVPAKPQPRDQRNHVGGAVAGRTVCADQRGGPDAPLFRSAAI